LSYLPFIARAVCLALGDFPRINASVDGDSLLVHRAVNLAIAVDLNFAGLVAPVIRNARELKVSELALRIDKVVKRARNNELVADDLSGGTYTLSNPGPFGTLFTAPIINQPQVAILSIDAIGKRPVVVAGPEGDAIGIHPVGVLAHSFDHRAFDGAYSAAFLNRLKSLLEQQDWSSEF
jgi:2-oxoglutarate dehydrogenase E2 component (dihydrolipoamide succinyltransferase)